MLVRPVDAPLPIADQPIRGFTVITDDGGGIATRLADRLREICGTCEVVSPAVCDAEPLVEIVARLRTAHGPITRIVHV